MIEEIRKYATKLAAEKGVEVFFRSQERGGGRSSLLVSFEDSNASESFFRSQISHYGGDPDWFGRKVRLGSDTFTVSGFNPKARKNCITIRRDKDDKNFVSSVLQVKQGLI